MKIFAIFLLAKYGLPDCNLNDQTDSFVIIVPIKVS